VEKIVHKGALDMQILLDSVRAVLADSAQRGGHDVAAAAARDGAVEAQRARQ
jgi:hypothetical protein